MGWSTVLLMLTPRRHNVASEGLAPLAASRQPSVHAAINQGAIRETAEVAEWLIVWGAYCALLDER